MRKLVKLNTLKPGDVYYVYPDTNDRYTVVSVNTGDFTPTDPSYLAVCTPGHKILGVNRNLLRWIEVPDPTVASLSLGTKFLYLGAEYTKIDGDRVNVLLGHRALYLDPERVVSVVE